MYYLTYFYKVILSKALTKTYNEDDKIAKNEIRYLYEYWIKHAKDYFEKKGVRLR